MTLPIMQCFLWHPVGFNRDEDNKNILLISKLQLVQNAALNTFVHLTLISAPLHWFLECFRIDLEISMITFKAHFKVCLDYIPDLIWAWGSSNRGLLVIPRSRLKAKWDQAFEIHTFLSIFFLKLFICLSNSYLIWIWNLILFWYCMNFTAVYHFYSIFPLLCLCKVLYQYSYYCYYHYYKLHINFTLSFIKKKN